MTRKYDPDDHCCDSCADKATHAEPTTHAESAGASAGPGIFSREVLVMGAGFVLLLLGIIFQPALERTPWHLAEYALFLSLWFFAGRNVLASALRNIVRGRVFDENFLMAIATIGAIAVHALPEAAGVMIFFRIGEYFQDRAVNSSRARVKALLDIRPEFATLDTGSGLVRVAPEEVAVGSTIVVRPGEKIPLDGVIVAGNSLVDTSALTGESMPRAVGDGTAGTSMIADLPDIPSGAQGDTGRSECSGCAETGGDAVLAGMISISGLLVIRTTRSYGESSVARILDLVENATNRKARTERFFSTFARYYTPAVVGIALATAILPPLLVPGQSFADWVYRALIMLVISCPCALVVSIPLAYFGGIGAASHRGILIKGSDYLDALGRVGTVVMDKTGTITSGKFRVAEIMTSNGFSKEDLLEMAAQAEAHSNHPIALSIRQSCYSDEDCRLLPEAAEYEELGGLGVRARVGEKIVLAGNDRMLHEYGIAHDRCDIPGSVVHVAVDGLYSGYLVIMDMIKEDSADAIAGMKAAGVGRIVMLTGDNESSAADIAARVGIAEYHAGLLPGDKVSLFETIAGEGEAGHKTAFVGDGINDAPVLARADIGISMGGAGSQAAIETSDVVIMNDSLSKVAEAIGIARKTRKILVQNIVFALSVKAAFIVLGFLGLASMWEAVFGDTGVALLAVLNSTRVMSRRG